MDSERDATEERATFKAPHRKIRFRVSEYEEGASEYGDGAESNPIYPIPGKLRRELTNPKGPKIDIYVGTDPCREYVMPVPKAILAYFSPAYRGWLGYNHGPLTLRDCEKDAVSWLMNCLVLGGVEKRYSNAPRAAESPEQIFNRLKVLVKFEITGKLYNKVFEDFTKSVIAGKITAQQLVYLFKPEATNAVKGLCRDLAWTIVEGVLCGFISMPVVGVTSSNMLKHEVSVWLGLKINRLHAMQHVHLVPLTVFQLNFIYTFTGWKPEVRKKVVKDLLHLMDIGRVKNGNDYRQYARNNLEFGKDMDKAIDEKAAWRAAQRKNAALTSEPNSGLESNQTRHTSNNAVPRSFASYKSIPRQKVIAKPRPRRGVKASQVTKTVAAPGNATSAEMVGDGEASQQFKSAKEAEDGEAAKEGNQAEDGEPEVKSKPASRLESNAVLRITIEGEVKRER